MRSLKDRIAALEAGSGIAAGVDADPARRAAYERIFAALRASLPVVPATVRYVDRGTYNTFETESQGVSFEEQIMGLYGRMQGSALTDDDRRVLASLPSEDLKIAGTSPERVVEPFWHLFSAY